MRLEGGSISFRIFSTNGVRMRCKGKVLGDRMEGGYAAGGSGPGRWTAVRKERARGPDR